MVSPSVISLLLKVRGHSQIQDAHKSALANFSFVTLLASMLGLLDTCLCRPRVIYKAVIGLGLHVWHTNRTLNGQSNINWIDCALVYDS